MMNEITVKLDPDQYGLLHRLAQIRELEDPEIVLGYIQFGLDADLSLELRDLLPIKSDRLEEILKGITE